MKALLALALLPAMVVAQEPDWLGMTPAQVEKMGRIKFMDAFGARHGNSTAAMCESERSFGAALRVLNDAHEKKHSPKNKAVVARLRPLAEQFFAHAADVGYAISGGGTMWNPVYAGVPADVEEIVAQLYGRAPLAPGVVQAEVWKTIVGAEATVRDSANEIDEPFLPDRRPSEDAKTALGSMRSLFYQIVKETAGLTVAQRTAVYGALNREVKTNLDMAGAGRR